MENWEFLLQRKGDKSWLPLESPTVEILEGQYRLAARSALANALVGIAIAYRPLADVRHQPFQQKIAKRISHDGLLIVMPYTNFVPGSWQIDCLATESDAESGKDSANTTANTSVNTNLAPAWKKTVKFDVIQISSEAGSEWQYSDVDEDLDNPTEILNEAHTNALGIIQTEPTPLIYSSPILDIAEQRSTELVQSMFEEFALFNDEDESDEVSDSDAPESESEVSNESPNLLAQLEISNADIFAETDSSLQPRILLRLKQPQYILNEDNSFNLTGEAYTQGEVEVSLKDPQTLDLIVNQRFVIAKSSDHHPTTGAIPFNYQIIVPPPSEIQVLIGDVQIHPHQDFPQDIDLFVAQQAIAVSYPASRVLPELIKEAQQYSTQENTFPNSQPTETLVEPPSYPQFPQGFPQVSSPTESQPENLSPKPKSANSLSLPPIPSNKSKASQGEVLDQQKPTTALSLPPLPSAQSKTRNATFNSPNLDLVDDYSQSFPQVEADEIREIEPEFQPTTIDDLAEVNRQYPLDKTNINEEEPELFYSFEEELPQNYEELLEASIPETSQSSRNPLPTPNDPRPHNRNNRFLNKLQTLSAEAIAAQKASQRTEELLLDTFAPSDPLLASEAAGDSTNISIDLDNPEQAPRTIAEATSLAELDLELDVELDRLLTSEPDFILNEYVWEESIDPNSFPISAVSPPNSTASTLSETARTIRNIQETTPQALSDQEPIPIPEIIIPAGEMLSGTPMQIAVRLPAITPKFFVKFWIKDLQTRMIVDGPRWLLDFSKVPNAEFIETRTNISIPLSSIDVAFEAIAIEAQTQRESHKVRVTRAVTPPNLAQDFEDT
ncbi:MULTISPECIES: hypothetical protein [Pseudanabaena]|jgi:hypothetical protein|uniref:hypothetical protein n=1 Tax=Pseudanabaena TaxID=1152 RepID=UPI002478E3F9|nr:MULTISPECIES: hypothetical protein [Pseudanabaena]MEA5489465.1 hypothetical protein [Pseudanabaena sp. CCNP1317]WGS71517.1 hypothetical protein OA858_17635 [Pseudanabaena galeata CCNP1313]